MPDSITRNLLIPNARHNCDVFVHYFNQTQESSGPFNRGGSLDPAQVFELRQAVLDVHADHFSPPSPRARTNHGSPQVQFVYDTDESFDEKRGKRVQKYLNTRCGEEDKTIYFPYRAGTYRPSNVGNIVKQWHSIETVFQQMIQAESRRQISYSRVGMFRLDVLYATPIDIPLTGRLRSLLELLRDGQSQ